MDVSCAIVSLAGLVSVLSSMIAAHAEMPSPAASGARHERVWRES